MSLPGLYSCPSIATDRLLLRAHRPDDFDTYATMWADGSMTVYHGTPLGIYRRLANTESASCSPGRKYLRFFVGLHVRREMRKFFPFCRNPKDPDVIGLARDMTGMTMMETTMKYMLMLYIDEKGMAAADELAQTKTTAAYTAYTDAMKKAGIWLGGGRLRPTETATLVRLKDGRQQVVDGPYADTKEQLGGYYMIEAPDMDAALSWAARCPTAGHGTVEVRPLWY